MPTVYVADTGVRCGLTADHITAFAQILSSRHGRYLHAWIAAANADDQPDLHSFAAGAYYAIWVTGSMGAVGWREFGKNRIDAEEIDNAVVMSPNIYTAFATKATSGGYSYRTSAGLAFCTDGSFTGEIAMA